MKRIGIIVCLLAMAAGVMAGPNGLGRPRVTSKTGNPYVHSLGGVIGGLNGVSYKGFIFGIPGLALQADLGVRLSVLGPRFSANYSWSDGTHQTQTWKLKHAVFYFTFEANPNIVYQGQIYNDRPFWLSWYAGGGVSIGMMEYAWNGYSDYKPGDELMSRLGGKFGINAIGGLELGLRTAPVIFDLDFRPGYGLGFWTAEDNISIIKARSAMSYFDWAITASIRYQF